MVQIALVCEALSKGVRPNTASKLGCSRSPTRIHPTVSIKAAKLISRPAPAWPMPSLKDFEVPTQFLRCTNDPGWRARQGPPESSPWTHVNGGRGGRKKRVTDRVAARHERHPAELRSRLTISNNRLSVTSVCRG